MYKYLLITIITFSSLSIMGQTRLTLRNNTSKEIYAAYASWNDDYGCWVSKGWYKLSPYKAKSLSLGDYEGTVYVHAHYDGLLTETKWGSEKKFCIDPTNAFEIYYAGKLECDETTLFSSMRVSNGEYTYFFNP